MKKETIVEVVNEEEMEKMEEFKIKKALVEAINEEDMEKMETISQSVIALNLVLILVLFAIVFVVFKFM